MCGKNGHKDYEKHHDYCDKHDYDCDCFWKHEKDKYDESKFRSNYYENCVGEVLEAIDKAQKKVKKEDDCNTSCKESIGELLGSKKRKKNTIPFILYCGDCEPFKATGVTTFTHHSKEKKFACITSFIFRIKEFDGKCAVLELLTFKHCKSLKDPFKNNKDFCSPCSQIDCENVEDLIPTGICINIDLSCFCAVTCLPAVRI